jgi:hypothetical protein
VHCSPVCSSLSDNEKQNKAGKKITTKILFIYLFFYLIEIIMKKSLFIFAAVLMMAGLGGRAVAQDTNTAGDVITYQLDAMAILDIEGTAPALHLIKPNEAGSPVPDVSSELSWLNYTSIIGTGLTNKVTVVLTKVPPTFTTLKVVAAAHAGTGDGTYGTASSELTLASAITAQDIITAIGSCWTGTGNTNGHKLTYTWGITGGSYEDAISVASATDITATYTIIATVI